MRAPDALRLLAAALAVSAGASAALLPPARIHLETSRLVVADEADKRVELRTLEAGAPTLLLPIFTRCGGTCPVTASALKSALAAAHAPFRVIALSFDGADTATDLAAFRARLGLPAGWRLARSVDAAATRAFFDQLEFHFMTVEGGFDHPDETFVLSAKGAWAATLSGPAFREEDLEAAFAQALAADAPGASRRLASWLRQPEAWIAIACSGLALSLLAIFWLANTRRSRPI